MFCSKCGRPIPEGSAFCSECGAPVAGVTEKAENAAENVQGAAEKVQSAAENVADKVQNAAEAAEVNTQNAAEKAQNAAENAADKAQSTVENAAENMQNAAESAEVKAQGVAGIAAEKASEPGAEKAASGTQEQSSGKPKKKGKAGLVIGIILAIVLLLGASAGAAYIFAREQVENFIHVKFDKPEEYYTYVAKKNFDKSADLIPEGYDELVKKQMDIFNSAFHQKVQVKLGDRGKDFLKLAVGTGVDITWINSAAVDYTIDFQEKNDKFSMAGKAILNEEQIISGLLMMDMKEGRMAFQIPELTEKYAKLDLDENYNLEETKEMFQKYAKLIESYPDVSYLRNKVKEYMEFYLEQVEEVEKTTETLEADDVTMECTCLTVVLREKDIQKLLNKILDDMAQDSEIENMVKNMAEIADEDPEEFYQEYQEEIEKAKEKLAEDLGIDRIRWATYVDKKSNILGRKCIIDPKEERIKSAETEFVVLPKEDKLGIALTVKSDDKKLVFAGTGKVKEGKLEGDFRLKLDDQKLMNLTVEEFDLEAAKKGNLIGHFNFKPGADVDLIGKLCDTFGLKDESPAKVFLSALNLSLDVKTEYTPEKQMMDVGIQDGGLDIVRIIVSGEMQEGSSIELPAEAVDVDEKLEDYIRDIKVQKLMDALAKANVPEEYYDSLNGLEEEIEEYLEYLEKSRKSINIR